MCHFQKAHPVRFYFLRGDVTLCTMTREQIHVHFNTLAALQAEFDANLKNGGTFVARRTSLAEHDECDVILHHPDSDAPLVIHARAVWISPDHSGVGVAFIGFSPEKRAEIQNFIEPPGQPPFTRAPDSKPAATSPDNAPILESFSDGDSDNASVHQKLRNLNTSEQHKVARGNNPSERIALERIYGKNVWEPLLHNPRLTIPEVARIARMGALPIPLVELIVNNPSWVASPPVRRALLANPRLSRDQVPRVLKSMPSGELRLVPRQMSYTAAVRETARRMLRG
jgi:Tfp pilus assembly protein PilZ